MAKPNITPTYRLLVSKKWVDKFQVNALDCTTNIKWRYTAGSQFMNEDELLQLEKKMYEAAQSAGFNFISKHYNNGTVH